MKWYTNILVPRKIIGLPSIHEPPYLREELDNEVRPNRHHNPVAPLSHAKAARFDAFALCFCGQE